MLLPQIVLRACQHQILNQQTLNLLAFHFTAKKQKIEKNYEKYLLFISMINYLGTHQIHHLCSKLSKACVMACKLKHCVPLSRPTLILVYHFFISFQYSVFPIKLG